MEITKTEIEWEIGDQFPIGPKDDPTWGRISEIAGRFSDTIERTYVVTWQNGEVTEEDKIRPASWYVEALRADPPVLALEAEPVPVEDMKDGPFERTPVRNDTSAQYVVRVGYKVRRLVKVEDELEYMDDPHPKAIDVNVNAGVDTSAVASVLDNLRDSVPNEITKHDKIEILELKIIERPTPLQ